MVSVQSTIFGMVAVFAEIISSRLPVVWMVLEAIIIQRLVMVLMMLVLVEIIIGRLIVM